MIWKVPREWEGGTCVILAGGPSLKGVNPAFLRYAEPKVRVIAINDSWRIAPWADVLYFCDHQWWQRQRAMNRRTEYGSTYSFHDMIYKGFWVTVAPSFADHPQVRTLTLTGQLGLETDPRYLKHGSNSGYQAIGLAYHYGAKKIILMGYDMRCDGGKTHWHNDHAAPSDVFAHDLEKSMLPCFRYIAAPLKESGIEVVNATPGSALTVWPYQPIEEALGLTIEKEI